MSCLHRNGDRGLLASLGYSPEVCRIGSAKNVKTYIPAPIVIRGSSQAKSNPVRILTQFPGIVARVKPRCIIYPLDYASLYRHRARTSLHNSYIYIYICKFSFTTPPLGNTLIAQRNSLYRVVRGFNRCIVFVSGKR